MKMITQETIEYTFAARNIRSPKWNENIDSCLPGYCAEFTDFLMDEVIRLYAKVKRQEALREIRQALADYDKNDE